MARSSQSAEVDQNVTAEGTVTKASPFSTMLKSMALQATLDVETNRFSGDDVNGILIAGTVEEIWDADEQGPINFKDLAGCDLEILDFSVKYSRPGSEINTPFVVFDDRTQTQRKMYLLADCVRISDRQDDKMLKLPEVGERFQANTSARFIVAKIWAFALKGLIQPDEGKTLRCRVQATDLGGDQKVLKLRPVDSAPVVSSVA